MGRMKRVAMIREQVESMVFDAGDLVGLLEISIEEILDRFPHKLIEHQDKFDLDMGDTDETFPD